MRKTERLHIKKYRSPEGDGNIHISSFVFPPLIKKYRSPEGDGNVIMGLPFFLVWCRLRNIGPRKGTETINVEDAAKLIGMIKKYRSPEGDENFKDSSGDFLRF